MKSFLKLSAIVSAFIISAMSYTALASVNEPDGGEDSVQAELGPRISFDEKKYDFGIIPEEGGPVSHFFEFTNTGDKPLYIISATASCGCTRPSYPTDPIAPGKKGKIKVTYLPEGRPGAFFKNVKVRTNAKESKKVSLMISGTVKPK